MNPWKSRPRWRFFPILFICSLFLFLANCALFSTKYAPNSADSKTISQKPFSPPPRKAPRNLDSLDENSDRSSLPGFKNENLDDLSISPQFELAPEFTLPIVPEPQALLEGFPRVHLPDSLNRPVEVGIAKIGSNVDIESDTPFIIIGPTAFQSLKIRVNIKQENLLKIVLANGRILEANSLKIIPGKSPLLLNQSPYRGNFFLRNQNGKLSVINSLPMEEYLKGVLPHEIGVLEQWGFEALKAQAVAARTYAYRSLNSRRNQGFDVWSDTRDQMYLGMKEEYPLSNQAIIETNGLVAMYQNELIEAYYHSTCGGQTAAVSVWGKANIPYLKSVKDVDQNGMPWCHRSSYLSWQKSWSDQELNFIARQYAETSRAENLHGFWSIRQIKVLEYGQDGRALRTVFHTNNGNFLISGDRIRWLFRDKERPDKILPSAKLIINHKEDRWIVDGQGFGHGIGMCQMGARERSRQGQGFEEILKAYYTGIQLIQMR